MILEQRSFCGGAGNLILEHLIQQVAEEQLAQETRLRFPLLFRSVDKSYSCVNDKDTRSNIVRGLPKMVPPKQRLDASPQGCVPKAFAYLSRLVLVSLPVPQVGREWLAVAYGENRTFRSAEICQTHETVYNTTMYLQSYSPCIAEEAIVCQNTWRACARDNNLI